MADPAISSSRRSHESLYEHRSSHWQQENIACPMPLPGAPGNKNALPPTSRPVRKRRHLPPTTNQSSTSGNSSMQQSSRADSSKVAGSSSCAEPPFSLSVIGGSVALVIGVLVGSSADDRTLSLAAKRQTSCSIGFCSRGAQAGRPRLPRGFHHGSGGRSHDRERCLFVALIVRVFNQHLTNHVSHLTSTSSTWGCQYL